MISKMVQATIDMLDQTMLDSLIESIKILALVGFVFLSTLLVMALEYKDVSRRRVIPEGEPRRRPPPRRRRRVLPEGDVEGHENGVVAGNDGDQDPDAAGPPDALIVGDDDAGDGPRLRRRQVVPDGDVAGNEGDHDQDAGGPPGALIVGNDDAGADGPRLRRRRIIAPEGDVNVPGEAGNRRMARAQRRMARAQRRMEGKARGKAWAEAQWPGITQ